MLECCLGLIDACGGEVEFPTTDEDVSPVPTSFLGIDLLLGKFDPVCCGPIPESYLLPGG